MRSRQNAYETACCFTDYIPVLRTPGTFPTGLNQYAGSTSGCINYVYLLYLVFFTIKYNYD